MANFAPPQAIDGPPRETLPYGLFSTFAFRPPTSVERWENGVEWEALSCDLADLLEPDCLVPSTNSYGACLRGEAPGFVVVAGQKSGTPGGRADLRTEEQAVARLLATEEVTVERKVWDLLRTAPDIDALVATNLDEALALAEQYMGDTYGSRGVIHMTRRAASLLGTTKMIPSGSRLVTLLGSPVAAGGGYGQALPDVAEVQSVTPGDVTVTGGTYTLTYAGQTTAPIAWNANAAAVQAALIALSNIAPGDVTVTGGPGPGVAFLVTFGGTLTGNVAQITSSSSLTGGVAPAVIVTTVTPGVDNVADPMKIIVSPPVFGYRGAVQVTSLVDPHLNDAYSLAQRGYTIGWDPCPIASITFTP
jgi:hypothetical protein